MNKTLFAFALFICSTAGAQVFIGDPNTEGPVLIGKTAGSKGNTYIPFSSGDANPVIATESFALPRQGGEFRGALSMNGASASNKLWITKVNKLRPDTPGPKTLGADSQYILLGGYEYGKGSYRGIGIGFSPSSDRVAAVFVGAQETDGGESTNGDFVVATRSSVKLESPVVRLRVTSQGDILSADGYTPSYDQALATKKYVDDAIAAALKK